MEPVEKVKIEDVGDSDAILFEAVDRYHLMPSHEEEEFELSSEIDMKPLILSCSETYDMEAEESNREMEIEFDAVMEGIKLKDNCDDSKPGFSSIPKSNEAHSSQICRLCTNRGYEMIDMFVENEEYENIVEKIEECLPIVIRRNDTLSAYACQSCLDKLNFYHEFYRSVIEADQRLRTLNQRVSTEVEFKEEGFRNNKGTTTTTVDDNGNNIETEANAMDKISSPDPNSQDVFTTQDRLEFPETDHHSDSKPGYRDKCDRTMTSKGILHPNVRDVDRQYKKYCCEVCGKQFRTRAKLKADQRKHCDDRSFESKTCRKRVYAGDTLSRHRKLHANDKQYRCDQCGKRFNRTNSLTRHQLSHQAETGNSANCQVCNVCKEVFADHRTADDHLKNCRITKKTKDRKIVVLDLKEIYRCEYCRRCFTEIAFIKIHRASHSEPTPYVCVVCGTRYSTYSQVTAHRMGHKKSSKLKTIRDSLPIPKYFTCQYCDKKYLRFTNMNVHRRSCSKKKKWTCKHSGTQEHAKFHGESRSYDCQVCTLSLRQANAGSNHTDEKRYRCDICGTGFKRNSNMIKHRRSKHVDEVDTKDET